MRVLIVGGGIAGLVLAAKLRQQGREPVVIEKAPAYADVGYAIGLFPLGSCVLHGLGVYGDFLDKGLIPERYEILDGRGRRLTEYPMSDFTAAVGPIVMIARSDLIDLLRRACGDVEIRTGTTVVSLEQIADEVAVELSDGSSERFDLVVGCDGIDSQIRELVIGEQKGFDTGWALRTWWAEPSDTGEVAREYWGPGWLFGSYAIDGRSMCIAGAPTKMIDEELGDLLAPLCEADPAIARSVAAAERTFSWPMTDVRSKTWRHGRVALCGDAAAAFLPTAGIGASCAMRAASTLADELSRASAAEVPLALEHYEQRARPVIEGNQKDSRGLARYMFMKSRLAIAVRDAVLRVYPARWAMRQIIKSMRVGF